MSRALATLLLVPLAGCAHLLLDPGDPLIVTEVEVEPKQKLCLQYIDFSLIPAFATKSGVLAQRVSDEEYELQLAAAFDVSNAFLGPVAVSFQTQGATDPTLVEIDETKRHWVLLTPTIDLGSINAIDARVYREDPDDDDADTEPQYHEVKLVENLKREAFTITRRFVSEQQTGRFIARMKKQQVKFSLVAGTAGQP